MGLGRCLRWCALAVLATHAPAGAAALTDAPGIPLAVPVTGEPVGYLGRVDGSVPDEEAAARDRADCLLRRDLIPLKDLRRLLRLARTDRPAAYRETTHLLEPCMFRKGWRTEFCGGTDEPPCGTLPYDEGHDEPG